MTPRTQPPPASFRRSALWLGATAFAIGAVAVAGWALQVRILQSFYPGWVTMKANTAFALIAGGLAVVLYATAPGRPLGVFAARALGGFMAAIGIATVLQYALDMDFGIDQLVFSAANDLPLSADPGRPAAVTAIAFTFLGCALALLGSETRRGTRPAQLLAIAGGAVALAALVGFAYGTIPTVGPGHGIQIAVHTAIAIVLIAAGALALEARHGWMATLFSRSAGGELARRLLPVAFAVPVALGALRELGNRAGMPPVLDGAGVLAVMTMLVFAAVIWRTVRAVNEAEGRWQASEQERLLLAAKAEAARELAVAERAARESADRAVVEKDEALTLLNLVLDSSPAGFALFDRDLRVRRVNRAFAEITGASTDALVLGRVHDVVPAHAEEIAAGLRHVLETGEPVLDTEHAGLTPQVGRSRDWLVSKYPVRSREGTIVGVGMILMDTTERRELEAQLQQAQKMEAIGQLAGGVSHDFNNVLTAIRSFAELVAAGLPQDSGLHDDVREIIAGADRGAALTRQLLAFSRQQRLQPTVVDLNSVAEGVAKLLERLIGPDIECRVVLAEGLGRVLADTGQIEQVIVNLAVNARDAMREGGILTIETGNVSLTEGDRFPGVEPPRAGDYVMLAVRDTGHGMDRKTQARIFEPFFTTKEAGKGTGLGLSTVYGIVRQSAGYVSVESEVGHGTTFRVYLPRVDAEVAASVERPSSNGTFAGNSATILLVDDDKAIRAVLTRVLERAGFTVLSAGSAADAERVWSEHDGPIQLLVTDLMMPEVRGDELAQRIVRARPDVKVLYTSGYADAVVLQRGLIRPGDPFLAKPFMIEDVVSAVRQALTATSK